MIIGCPLSVVCPFIPSSLVYQQFLLTTYLPKPLGRISPNITGISFGYQSPFKSAKILPFDAELRLPWQPKAKKYFYWPFQGGPSFVDHLFYIVLMSCVCHAFASVHFCMWSPAGKGLTSWLLYVMFNCVLSVSHVVSWVRCGTWLYRILTKSGPSLGCFIRIFKTCHIGVTCRPALEVAYFTERKFEVLHPVNP